MCNTNITEALKRIRTLVERKAPHANCMYTLEQPCNCYKQEIYTEIDTLLAANEITDKVG